MFNKNNLENYHDLLKNIIKASNLENISLLFQRLEQHFDNDGKLFLAGNGGSAADSQHMAAEFVSKFYHDRNAMPAIALTTDTSILTSISNDYDYSNIFARQIEAIGREGDIFIPITTSGNSKNLINAVKTANNLGLKVVALTGATGGALEDLCSCIKIPSTNTPRIQECHILIGHIVCELVEADIFSEYRLQ